MGVRKMKNKKGVSYKVERRFGGKRYYGTFKSEEAAWEFHESIERKLKTEHPGSNQHQKIITVRQAMARLVAQQKGKNRDPRTIAAYLETFNHLAPILGINISDLKKKDLVDCFKKIRNLNNGSYLSRSRLFKFLGRLTRAFNLVAREGVFMKHFDDAEADIVGFIDEYGLRPVEEMPYDEEALRKLLEYEAPKGKKPWWILPLIKLYLFTGKRFGEIQALTNDKIDHEKMTIYIDCMISGRMFHDHLKSRGKPHFIMMDKELSNGKFLDCWNLT